MSCKCCGCKDTFYAPPIPTNPDLSDLCNDFIKATIQAIVNLRTTNGNTFAEILAEIEDICSITIDPDELSSSLNSGLKKGVFRRSIRDSEETYVINGAMVIVNPLNQKYMRSLCDFYQH